MCAMLIGSFSVHEKMYPVPQMRHSGISQSLKATVYFVAGCFCDS